MSNISIDDRGNVTSSAAPVTFADSPNFDAFSRLRVSETVTLFDAQFSYDLQPLLYEAITAETGATIAHDATNRSATLTFADTPTGGRAEMRTFEHFRYQPGKSQLVFVTFNMRGGVANVTKFAGYSNGANGVEFAMVGTTPTIRILSDTGVGDKAWTQTEWTDRMDGTGESRVTLDFTKTQILVIDIQALYVGRVRVGFDVDGEIVYALEAKHANRAADPYIQTANLPVRVGMTTTATVSTTVDFVCCSVNSEGGQDDTVGYEFSQLGAVTAAESTNTHALSIRPRTTFNGIENRARVLPTSVDLLVTGTSPVRWQLLLGQSATATAYTNHNVTYSTIEYSTSGSFTGTPAAVVAQGFVAASVQNKTAASTRTPSRYPLTLGAAGAHRTNGTLTLAVQGVGGDSACQMALGWKEIR